MRKPKNAPQLPKPAALTIGTGLALYMDHISHPVALGGVTSKTLALRRAVCEKFQRFARDKSLAYWCQLSDDVLQGFDRHLEQFGYAVATRHLELTTVKKIHSFLMWEHHIEQMPMLGVKIVRPAPNLPWFFGKSELSIALNYCAERKNLTWLRRILVALVYSGMRLSELGQVKWTDVDLDEGFIEVKGTTQSGAWSCTNEHQVPIHPELQFAIEAIPAPRSDPVFRDSEDRPISQAKVRAALRQVVIQAFRAAPSDKATARHQQISLFAFRHFFVGNCCRCGVPEGMVRQWLGLSRRSPGTDLEFIPSKEFERKLMNQVRLVSEPDAV